MSATEYTLRYFAEVQQLAAGIDPVKVDSMVEILRETRENSGRLFLYRGRWGRRPCKSRRQRFSQNCWH